MRQHLGRWINHLGNQLDIGQLIEGIPEGIGGTGNIKEDIIIRGEVNLHQETTQTILRRQRNIGDTVEQSTRQRHTETIACGSLRRKVRDAGFVDVVVGHHER